MSDERTELQKAADRFDFAAQRRNEICAELRKIEDNLWDHAARRAKEQGLYSASTYLGDIRNALRRKAGLVNGSMIKQYPEEIGR
jgi:hypothetical protein